VTFDMIVISEGSKSEEGRDLNASRNQNAAGYPSAACRQLAEGPSGRAPSPGSLERQGGGRGASAHEDGDDEIKYSQTDSLATAISV